MNSHHRMLTRAKKQEVVFFGLENPLILSNIFSFLPLKDLKTTRKVNRRWKETSQKYFKRRAMADFHLCNMIRSFHLLNPKVEDYLEAINCQENLQITNYCREYPSYYNLFRKLVIEFISKAVTPIRRLEAELFQKESTDFPFLACVLKRFPHLVELDLYFELAKEAISKKDWMQDFAVLEPFPLVKIFVLSIQCEDDSEDNKNTPRVRELSKKLLQLTPNIQELKFKYSFSSQEWNTTYLKELMELQWEWNKEQKGPKPFGNLESFAVNLSHVEQLLGLLQPLRNLSLFSFSRDLNRKGSCLQELLKKNAETLESFSFYYENNYDDLNMAVKEIEFPNLPRLKSLGFHAKRFTRHSYDQHLGILAFNLPKLFMMGGNRFKEKFPLLQSFTWEIDYWYFNPMIYERIFPRPNREDLESVDMCFPQFTSLDLYVPKNEDEEYINDEPYKDWMIWLTKMFPNVHNPQLNKARLLPLNE